MTRAAVATKNDGVTHSTAGSSAGAPRMASGDTGFSGPFSRQVVTEKDPRIRAELSRLLDAAREIRPQLREDQAACEERGYYSEDIHAFFVSHGFYKMLQPLQYGGLELGPSAFYQVIAEVARGCPSTAWCLSLGSGHALTLGSYFSAEAQRDIWGGELGYMVCPASGQGRDMTVTRVEGGWRIAGTWRYASGAPYSTHFMATAYLPGEGPGDDQRRVWMILQRKDFEIVWDWGRVIGMKGSGSQGITTAGAFVPDHFVSEETWTAEVDGPTIGYEALGNPYFNGTFFGFAEGEVASTSVGLGYAAIDEYQRIITSSTHPWVPDGGLRAEHQEWQRVLGMATAYVDAAQATLVHSARLYEEYGALAAAGVETFDESRSFRLNGVYFVVEDLVYRAMDLLLRTAGTQHSADGARLQRYFRDALTTRTRTDQFEGFSVNTGIAQLDLLNRL